MQVPPERTALVLDLYDKGLYLQAYRTAAESGPLAEWTGTEARVLAGRLAYNVGAPRLGSALHISAWRADRGHPLARYYYARTVLQRRGALEAWRHIRDPAFSASEDPVLRAHWMALRGATLAHLRDFTAAEECLRKAEDLAPGDPWVEVERSSMLELEDRYEDALRAARRSLELSPWFRPGVQAAAHLLELLCRDGEALELLEGASRVLESNHVEAQIGHFELERRNTSSARRRLDRFAELSPLMDAETRRWWNSRCADVAYLAGDRETAAKHAALAENPFSENMARSLASPREGSRRVELDVPFVRQHDVTCAPATLSAICRYWQRPAEHLEIAAEICYDGTPAWEERRWAEANGLITREFRVTWEAAVALIDRGIPFTLTTVEPGLGHLQAVMGYDSLCGLLLIRDPFFRQVREAVASSLLERYRSTGPRGMVLVPGDRAELLDGIDLPDAGLHDHQHSFNEALGRHDRSEAHAILEKMRSAAPDHLLTLQVERQLAIYDADEPAILSWNRKLVALYPETGCWSLGLLASLRNMESREARIALLEPLSSMAGPAPIFLIELASELLPDARASARCLRLLRAALRLDPRAGEGAHTLASLLWTLGRFDESLEVYRFAACIAPRNERLSASYFTAARSMGRRQEALEFLEARVARLGGRSSQPALTLFWALDQLGRAQDGFELLDRTMAAHPEDGNLLLSAAASHARYGSFERAAALLAAAERRAPRSAWLRTSADLAEYEGSLAKALELRREVALAEPLNVDAQAAVARITEQVESHAAALAHLRQAAAGSPENCGLQAVLIEWLGRDDPPEAEEATRRLIAMDPSHGWARRERALLLGRMGRWDEAFAEMHVAAAIEPQSPATYMVLGDLKSRTGSADAARDAFRRAIRLSADSSFAIRALLRASSTPEESRREIDFVIGELRRQVVFGEGLLAFQAEAGRVLPAGEALGILEEAHRARPDLWPAWWALVSQLSEMSRLDDALRLAEEATRRFPLLPQAWLELAKVREARGDAGGQMAAIEQSLRVRPGQDDALRQLSVLHEKAGMAAKARSLLEQAAAWQPLNAINHGGLARLYWSAGEKEQALERITRAVRLAPGYEWAWGRLEEWSRELGRMEAALDVARGQTRERPADALTWLALARLAGSERLEESLAALEKAIELQPRLEEAHDFRARLLARAGKFEEAAAACAPAALGPQDAHGLRARAAWVEAERGNLEAAFETLRGILARDPDHWSSWQMLSDWADRLDRKEEYLEASRNMVRLAPDDPVSWGYLADAKLRLGFHADGKEDLRRAFRMNDGYAFAGQRLCEAEIEDGNLEAAEEIIPRLGSIGAPAMKLLQLKVESKRGDREKAREVFRDLCRSGDGAAAYVQPARELLSGRGWGKDVRAALEDLLEDPAADPAVGGHWVLSAGATLKASVAQRAASLLPRGAIGESATVECLNILRQRPDRRVLDRLLRKHRAALEKTTKLWGWTGSALVASASSEPRRKRALDWLSSWRGREGLEPWMLANLALALRRARKDAEAAGVSEHALRLPPDGTMALHRLLLASDAVFSLTREGAKKARELAEGIPEETLDPMDRFLKRVVDALIEMELSPHPLAGGTHGELARKLRDARKITGWSGDAFLSRVYLRSFGRLGALRGGIRGRLAVLRAVIWMPWNDLPWWRRAVFRQRAR